MNFKRGNSSRTRQLLASLLLLVSSLHIACSAGVPARMYQLDYCQPSAWERACEVQTRIVHGRRDLYCSERQAPLRDALIVYCERHKAALKDIADNGRQAAKKYKYVASVYLHDSGLGNRMPGIVSGLFLALMTDRIFILDYQEYDRYFNSPIDFKSTSFLDNLEQEADGWKVFQNFLEDEYRSVKRVNQLLTEDLKAKYDEYAVWLTKHNADYPAATLSANPHYRQKMRLLFPSYEIYWPLSLLLFRLSKQMEGQVEAFQHLHHWSSYYIIGLQLRTKKAPVSNETWHRFADLAHSLAADAAIVGKPVQVFITADSTAAYAEVRQRLEAARDAGALSSFIITATDNEETLRNTTLQTEGHNPGTEEGAVRDMHLLKCAHAIIITSSSSFGWAAGGMSGLRPYFIPEHDGGFPKANSAHPAYWKATSSEPCNSLGWWKDDNLPEASRALWRAHPLHQLWRQCHTPHDPWNTRLF